MCTWKDEVLPGGHHQICWQVSMNMMMKFQLILIRQMLHLSAPYFYGAFKEKKTTTVDHIIIQP